MTIPLFPQPAPDFSNPLGLLAACHQRIRSHCELLERMLERLSMHGADAEVQAGARRVLRYFETAAPHHHADEEEDLFPLLAESTDLTDTLADLSRDHGRMDALWQILAPLLERLSRGQAPSGLAEAVADFVAVYRAHIAREDAEVLPAARMRLDARQTQALGQAMARRRRSLQRQ